MAASLLDALTPDTAEAVRMLVSYAASQGITLRPSSGKRSCDEQHALFAKGRTTDGPKVTYADGCNSWHVLGRAVDAYVTAGPKDYALLGAYWRSIGGVWGGDFTGAAGALQDFGHFEYHPGLKSVSQVCTNPATCAINAAANAPRVNPAAITPTPELPPTPDSAPSESSILPGLALASLLAVGAGWYFGRKR